MQIGVIGIAKSDELTALLYQKMYAQLLSYLNNFQDVTLISGGAAWSDHLAVFAYLQNYVIALELHLPCVYDLERKCFHDNGSTDWRVNPGGLANSYHKTFSMIIYGNESETLNQIWLAINKGAMVIYYDGFHARNLVIGNRSKLLIAFTLEEGAPTRGGTGHTWKNCNNNKISVSIGKL